METSITLMQALDLAYTATCQQIGDALSLTATESSVLFEPRSPSTRPMVEGLAPKLNTVPPEQGKACMVCTGTTEPDNVWLGPCAHECCTNCLELWIGSNMAHGQVTAMGVACPGGCSRPIPTADVEGLLSVEEFSRYTRFRLNAEIDADPTRTWCPQADCDTIIHLVAPADGAPLRTIKCTSCQSKICGTCGDHSHPRKSCHSAVDRSFRKWSRHAALWGGEGVQSCPTCRHQIQKAGGCRHMTCSRCGTQWCWLCGDDWAAHDPGSLCTLKFLHNHPLWGGSLTTRVASRAVAYPVLAALTLAGGTAAFGITVGIGAPAMFTYAGVASCRSLHSWRKQRQLKAEVYRQNELDRLEEELYAPAV